MQHSPDEDCGARFHRALASCAFGESARARIARAEELMRGALGRAGPRKGGSSPVDHTIRVATNVVGALGVIDPDLVIAALLHDVVEDAAEHLAPSATDVHAIRAEAIRRIEAEFGARVAGTVALVTLPDIDAVTHARIAEGDTRGHEPIHNEIYAEKIRRTIEQSTDAFTVKLADFLDNGVRMDPAARPGLAAKYRPLFTLVPEALRGLPIDAPLAARRDAVIAAIDAARDRIYGS